MPEGPEVRRHADTIGKALIGKEVRNVEARTRAAKAWLAEHGSELHHLPVRDVRSHGKHLIGWIGEDYYFHSHLMMWGRWMVLSPDDPLVVERDRRERARIAVDDAVALLLSAPIFDIGQGDPYARIPQLPTLGPDTLPYPDKEPFDREEFLRRLAASASDGVTIGAALLDQRIAAGIGNYLRAEILFECSINPWRLVAELAQSELECIAETIPVTVQHAYRTSGSTIPPDVRERMLHDPTLVYQPGREYGARHYVFRRTNLPCVRCGDTIRQRRQITGTVDGEDKTRIIYFCPTCQHVH